MKDEKKDIEDIEDNEVTVVKEFMDSENFTKFFPDQLITFREFKFPNIVIQTILKNQEEKYIKNPMDKDIHIIEYTVKMNYIDDPEYIGPKNDNVDMKIIDPENPFVLTIDSNSFLNDEKEEEYLDNFKTIFIELIQLIIKHVPKEEILEEVKEGE